MNLVPSFDPQGLPAPVWLLLSLKVFGFWVHLIFMGLWFAGFPTGLLLTWHPDTRPLGNRLLKTMPVWIAFGVNAGIVPLLFIQVLYPGFFYSASILQAWWWFVVIPLVMLAYYGSYLYAVHGLREGAPTWTRWVGWGSALIFLLIGVIFASTLTLSVHPEAWAEHAVLKGGAVLGSGLFASYEVFQRYLMVFALSLLTVAAFLVVDVLWLAPDGERTRTARPVVLGLVLAGSLVFLVVSFPYLLRIRSFLPPLWHGVVGTTMLLSFLLGTGYALRGTPGLGAGFVGAQLVNLLANAIARQLVQHREILERLDLTAVPVHVQVSPFLLFIAAFLAGLGAVVWMIRVYVRASRSPEAL